MAVGYFVRLPLALLSLHAAVSIRPEMSMMKAHVDRKELVEPTEEEQPPQLQTTQAFCKQAFESKFAAKHMKLGTKENMDSRMAELGLDFVGLWWMKGNPVPEVLASFAGATVNSSTYPAQMDIPHGRNAGHWCWRQGFAGNALMTYYSAADPSLTMPFNMESATTGQLNTQGVEVFGVEEWGFQSLNKDEWNRTTLFEDDALAKKLAGDNWYVLTRILNEDGSPTKHWAEFLESDDAKSGLQTYVDCGSDMSGVVTLPARNPMLLLILASCCVPTCCFVGLRLRRREETEETEEKEETEQ